MNIELKETKPQEATINVTITPEDYLSEVNAELQKQRREADLRGFRKGKAPLSLIKRMVGDQVLFRTVYDKALKALETYIEDKELKLIGQAIPSEQQAPLDWDINRPGEYTFSFDIGLAPEIELKGFDPEDTYDYYDVVVPEEEAERIIKEALEDFDELEETEDPIEEGMELLLEIEETQPEEGKDAHQSAFEIVLNENVTDQFKSLFLGKKVGDSFENMNIHEVFVESDEKLVREEILALDEEDEDISTTDVFHGDIKRVEKLVHAEANAEFFNEWLGEEHNITTMEEAKAFLLKDMKEQRQNTADDLLYREMLEQAHLLNAPTLPEEFLIRWFQADNREKLVTEAEFEKAKEIISKSLVDAKIIEKFKAEVTNEDIHNALLTTLYARYPFLRGNDQYAGMFLQQMLEDEKEVDAAYKNAMIKKSLSLAKDHVRLNPITIDQDAFFEKIVAINKFDLQEEE